jgi:hypothetical protein
MAKSAGGCAVGDGNASNTSSSNDMTRRVVATANRLRVIQTDFADQSEQVRKEYLQDEVQSALAGIVPEQRQVFLEQLQERFPTWDRVAFTPAAAAAGGGGGGDGATARSSFDQKELKDWTFLLSKLLELAPTLPLQARQTIAQQLAGAGLTPPNLGGVSPQRAASLKAKLQLAPNETVQPDRGAELLEMLSEFAVRLDTLMWNTWKQIASQSDIKRASAATLQKVIGRFAAGDQNVPSGQVLADVDRLRKLTAAMISAVGQVGRKFGEDQVNQFSPAQIEDLVKAQGGGGWGLGRIYGPIGPPTPPDPRATRF